MTQTRFPSTGGCTSADGWEKLVDEALEVGVESLSFGFARLAFPKATHAEHLEAVLAVKSEIDRLVG